MGRHPPMSPELCWPTVTLRACSAGPRALAYNPAENAVLVQTDIDGGSYELYQVPKDGAGRDVAPVSQGLVMVGQLPSQGLVMVGSCQVEAFVSLAC